MPADGTGLRQRGRDGVPRGIVSPVALCDRPLHHRSDTLTHPAHGFGLGVPVGDQDCHNVRGGDLIDALTAEPRHGIVPETRPPLFLALAGVFPAFAVDADDGFDRLGEGRHVGISSEGERIAARPCDFPVLEGRLPRFRQRDVWETAESCVTPDAIDGAAPYPLFGGCCQLNEGRSQLNV